MWPPRWYSLEPALSSWTWLEWGMPSRSSSPCTDRRGCPAWRSIYFPSAYILGNLASKGEEEITEKGFKDNSLSPEYDRTNTFCIGNKKGSKYFYLHINLHTWYLHNHYSSIHREAIFADLHREFATVVSHPPSRDSPNANCMLRELTEAWQKCLVHLGGKCFWRQVCYCCSS